jgi:hypothetical protein
MPLRYQDRFPRRHAEEHKDCFGREAYYRSTDPECQRCADYDECSDTIRDKRYGGSRISVRDRDRDEEKVEVLKAGKAGEVREGETPFTRFCKDCATGACRGALYEGYQFFCRFRF